MNTAINLLLGKTFDLANPAPDDIHLRDIAHALAHIARFTGHGRQSASVAQHCVHVVELCKRRTRAGEAGANLLRWALLHDAAEAYVGDVSRPLKNVLGDAYRVVADRVEAAVVARFGVIPEDIRLEDTASALAEKRANGPFGEWVIEREHPVHPAVSLSFKVPYLAIWPARVAELEFLDTAWDLGIS